MKRTLNVGCGSDTYGTDFVDLYPSRPEVKRCNFDNEKLPFRDNTFDEVFGKCVFEHLTNPGFALSEMVRVCKRGGQVVIITDNANYWPWFLGVSKTHLGGYEKFSDSEDRHYALFTDWHLKNHFRKHGVRVDSVEYIVAHGFLPVRVFNYILFFLGMKRNAAFRIKISGTKQ